MWEVLHYCQRMMFYLCFTGLDSMKGSVFLPPSDHKAKYREGVAILNFILR